MSRKSKYSDVQKIQACEDCLSGNESTLSIARKLGCTGRTISRWLTMYQSNGPSAFLPSSHNQSYLKEFKTMVAEAYLSGAGSLVELAAKYKLRSSTQLLNWVKKYTDLTELKDYTPQPEVYMANRKKTTLQEREEIVRYCLDHNRNYKETARLYECSYSQVYDWVRNYKKDPVNGLQDRRRKSKPASELTETERMQREINLLKRQLEEEKMRNELLKKVQEIERRRSSLKED